MFHRQYPLSPNGPLRQRPLNFDIEPISIATSVWGLLQASEKIISFLASIADAPNTAANVLVECRALNAIFTQVNDFISDQDQQSTARISRISLNYLVATLTGCVIAFSELDRVLKSLGATTGDGDSSNYQFTFFDKLKWKVKEKSIEKSLRNMQMHKTSLNLMIIIYSRSVASLMISPRLFYFMILFSLYPYHTTAAVVSQ